MHVIGLKFEQDIKKVPALAKSYLTRAGCYFILLIFLIFGEGKSDSRKEKHIYPCSTSISFVPSMMGIIS
jgi:hypothetical protein